MSTQESALPDSPAQSASAETFEKRRFGGTKRGEEPREGERGAHAQKRPTPPLSRVPSTGAGERGASDAAGKRQAAAGGREPDAAGRPAAAFSIMTNRQIYYSDKYDDEEFEYRHVMLPKDIAKLVPKTHLMSESEWRNLGVQQSRGWVHYMIHEPEPYILLFRRPLPKKVEK
uniref:Cyclin-dependent kinases regulatory subunit n=1 Tax=Naja naja TaxID=35670 RepID=A0A8C6VMJ5_NAJNA